MKKSIDFKKISEFSTPQESPGYLLWRVSTQWRSAIENVLRPLGLTHPQFVVMASLGWFTREGSKISQITIANNAGLDPNTTSQILRGLEKKKLIKRIHLSDERSKNPILTSTGSALLNKALPAVEKADALFFAQLNAQELRAFITLFQTLGKNE